MLPLLPSQTAIFPSSGFKYLIGSLAINSIAAYGLGCSAKSLCVKRNGYLLITSILACCDCVHVVSLLGAGLAYTLFCKSFKFNCDDSGLANDVDDSSSSGVDVDVLVGVDS